jgi:hypothetical protein
MDQLPKPPVPNGVDLHDFSFTPIFRTQLFRSTFHARSSDAEWRAGVTLWLKSWDQMPAGSLPDDDIELCRLAEFGRDQRSWKKVKGMALHGWYKCDDGRLYHPVVSEGVMAAYVRRRSAAEKGRLGSAKRWPVINGGISDASSNSSTKKIDSSANSSATQQLLPIDSKGQGDRQGERDDTPLPPLEKGESRQRRSGHRAERDEAVAKWNLLIESGGKQRDERVQKAIRAIGGWQRIAGRNDFEDSKIRAAFCDAYQAATQ